MNRLPDDRHKLSAAVVFARPERMTIGSIDDGLETIVEAHYNPKELTIEHDFGWNSSPWADDSKEARQRNGGRKGPTKLRQEFIELKPRAMTLELLFDGSEAGTAGTSYHRDVGTEVGKLEYLARLRDPSGDEDFRRPHHCVVAWGKDHQKFTCVIRSLSVKYTMFAKNGKPLRATCTVKLEEADLVRVAPKPERARGR